VVKFAACSGSWSWSSSVAQQRSCTGRGGGATPSDFPLARLDQPSLDRLLGTQARHVEELCPLAPLQQGMLFHTLLNAEPGAYSEHLSCTLRGVLDVQAFQQTWQQIIDRHAVLRSSFVWEGLAEPLQIVWRSATLPWQLYDWRSLTEAEQEERLKAFVRAEHVRGFVLDQAPLMRLALFRLEEQACTLV
jgi:condensation domain-containing protein